MFSWNFSHHPLRLDEDFGRQAFPCRQVHRYCRAVCGRGRYPLFGRCATMGAIVGKSFWVFEVNELVMAILQFPEGMRPSYRERSALLSFWRYNVAKEQTICKSCMRCPLITDGNGGYGRNNFL